VSLLWPESLQSCLQADSFLYDRRPQPVNRYFETLVHREFWPGIITPAASGSGRTGRFPAGHRGKGENGGAATRPVRHRRRSGESNPPPNRLNVRVERAAIRYLAGTSAVREGLNEPGLGPLSGMFRASPSDSPVGTIRCTGFEVRSIGANGSGRSHRSTFGSIEVRTP
jgi:hypothetical protein